MTNRANLNVHARFDDFSRMNSMESEKASPIPVQPLNEKKSRFFKSLPNDGEKTQSIVRIKRINESKKGKKKFRKSALLEEQRRPFLLQPQEKQRRKSAEGSLFGFLNQKISFLSQLAPFHPNHVDQEPNVQLKFDHKQQRGSRTSKAFQGLEELKTQLRISISATDLSRQFFTSEKQNNNNMHYQGNNLKNPSAQNGDSTPLGILGQTEKSLERQNKKKGTSIINLTIESQIESLDETPNHSQPNSLKNLLVFKPFTENSKQMPLKIRRNVTNWSDSKSTNQESDQARKTERVLRSQQQQRSGSSEKDLRGVFQNPQQYKNIAPKQREDTLSSSLSSNTFATFKNSNNNLAISKFISNTTNGSKTLTQIISEFSSQNFTEGQEISASLLKGKRNRLKLKPLSSLHELSKKKSKHHPQLSLNNIYIANNPLYQGQKKVCGSDQLISPKAKQTAEHSEFINSENNKQRVNSKTQKSRALFKTVQNPTTYATFAQLSSQNKFFATTLLKQKNLIAFHPQ